MELSTGSQTKKLPRIRRLANLASIRRELVRIYDEARAAGPDAIQFYRGLTFILGTASDVMKAERETEIEKRMIEIESRLESMGEKNES
jgi:hypothetical protein